MTGFAFDPVALSGLADRLRNSGQVVAGLAGTLPPVSDAGEVSAEIAALLGHLIAGTAELAGGVTAAGDAIAAGVGDHLEHDEQVRQSLQGSG